MSGIRNLMKKTVLIWVFLIVLICLPMASGAEGFTLPASMEVIEEEAFAGTAIENVEFPESLTEVGDRAFADNPDLEIVTFPATEILTVSDSAFENSDVMIRGVEGSYAEEWAEWNEVPFIPVSSGRPAALLIGQTNYRTFEPLPGSRNDVMAMRGFLNGLSNRFNTTVATDLTGDQMRRAIRSVFSSAKDTDVSLLYYSGHGKTDFGGTNHGALVGVDGDEGLLTFAELAGILSEVRGRVLVILDSCYSGAAITSRKSSKSSGDPLDAFLKDVIASFSGYTQSAEGIRKRSGELAVSKFIVIAAARYSEEAGEDSIGKVLNGYPCGVFTYSVLKGMGCAYPAGAYSGSMPADDGNLLVTLKEIFDYAYAKANSIWSVQHAVYYGTDSEVLFRRD